jgi:hypothetical protein
LFSIADLRATGQPAADATKYPDAIVADYRTRAEEAIEAICSVAFVPRYRRETVDGDGTSRLRVSKTKVRAVRSVATSTGSPSQAPYVYTTTDLANVTPASGGNGVYSSARWPYGTANVTVGYEHGYDRPPRRISQAAVVLAKTWMVAGPLDDRAMQVASDEGPISLSTPGVTRGAFFGIPEVDAAVAAYQLPDWVG